MLAHSFTLSCFILPLRPYPALAAVMSSWGKGAWSARKGKGSGGKAKGKAFGEKKDYVKKVSWENRLSKWYLRPYVDQAGSPFSANGVQESELLSSYHLRNILSEDSSEYCARQGIALSEGAANFEVGAGALQHHFGEDAGAGLKKVGIQPLLEQFQTANGKKFLEARAYLNTANTEVERNEGATAAAVKRFVRFLTHEHAEKEAAFRKLLRLTARLYIFAFEGLEAITALSNPKVMAAGVHAVGQQAALPEDCKAWLRAPEEQEALVWSLVAAFQHQKLEAGVKKRAAATYDWGEEPTAAAAWGKGGAELYGDDAEDDAWEAQRAKKTSKGKGGKLTSKQPAKKAGPLASDAEDDSKDIDLTSSQEDAKASASLDVTGWPLEKVDALKEFLAELEGKVDSSKDRPSIQQLQAVLQEVPETILNHQGLQKTVTDFMQKTRYPRTENLKALLKALKDMVAIAEAEWKK